MNNAAFQFTNRIHMLRKHRATSIPPIKLVQQTPTNILKEPETVQEDGFAMEQDMLDLFVTEINGELLIPE